MGKKQKSPFPSSSLNLAGAVEYPRLFRSVLELSKYVSLPDGLIEVAKKVEPHFPVRVPAFYLGLMELHNPFCPIKKQALPSLDELSGSGYIDPLEENGARLTPSFIKRYRGRGVFLISSECAMFCRFCNRKRLVGKGLNLEKSWEETFESIGKLEDLHEVIISGGDPFMESPEKLSYVLGRLRNLKNVKTIRISTRVPVVFPEGIKNEHMEVLSHFSPIWLIIHINHPKEITEQFKVLVRKFQTAGLPIVSQTVLLREVNDCAKTLIQLFEGLVELGVKPYYLFHLDEVFGAHHFKVRLSHGIKIYKALRKYASGLAIPNYVLDLSGGLGKVPVLESIVGREGQVVFFRGHEGKVGSYLDDGYESRCQNCGFCENT